MSYKIQSSKKLSLGTIKRFLAIIPLLVMAGCSGGDIPPPASTGGSTSGGTVTVGDLTMGALTFTDPVLSPYGITTISVTVLANGMPVATSIPVDFTSDCVQRGDATITTTANTVTGTATATYTDNGCGGNDTVTASIVDGPSNTGVLTVTPLTVSALTFGSNPLAALGITSVSVTLEDGANNYTSPATVEFNSQCASLGLATITSSTFTIGGVATATYTDLGCNNDDTISVSVPGLNNVDPTYGVLTVNEISMPAISFADPILSAYGTTTITAEVFDDLILTTIPITVNFSSTCATNGNATITQSATTVDGVATAFFTDNGCGGTDTIKASITNGPTVFDNFAINALTFVDPIVVTTNPLPAFSSTTIKVTLLDGTSNYTTPLTVNFTSFCEDYFGKATITKTVPVSGGVATAFYVDEGCQGNDQIIVTVPSLNNGPTITGIIAITPLDMGTMTFGSDPLAPYGTTQISVPILSGLFPNLSPVAVNFTSTCANLDKGTISQTVTSINGIATATFTDNGCGSTDTINASITNGPSTSGQLVINPLTMSTISYGVNPLSPYQNTTVSVTLLEAGSNYPTPTEVIFSSFCAGNSKATITQSVNTSGGTATATYFDDGCQGDDLITVEVPSLANGPSRTGTLTIVPLTFTTLIFTSNPLSSFGTTTISTSLQEGVNPYTSPATVAFDSICLQQGKATITPQQVNTSAGNVSVTYTDQGCNGDDTITVSTPSLNFGPTASAILEILPLTLGSITFGTSTLSPYGETTAEVTVLDGGLPYLSPMNVVFNSICASSGLATITSTVNTVSGVATATYTDNGCGGSDTITASITSGPAATATLIVTPLTITPITPGVSTLAAYQSTSLSVTLLDGLNNYALPTTVAFDSLCVQQGKAIISPSSSNTSNGTAVATYTDQGCSGDDYITATLPNLANGPVASGSLTITALTLGPLSFGITPPPLSAYGTTTAYVTVLSDGVAVTSPVVVNFSSLCATQGKATISSSATTQSGTATATYSDNGCNSDDLITATLSNGLNVSATLAVGAPDTGSLQYISTLPSTTIALQGAGGIVTSDTAQVKFRVLDTLGDPVPNRQVDFVLSTTIGGISLLSPSSFTDINGDVIADVSSGTIVTPIRITASTVTNAGVTIYSQSEELYISTGLPDQNSMSLSTESWNPPHLWETDGVQATMTARAADHFNNPVPDGTTFTFTTECGVIEPSCSTTDGWCSVLLSSQSPRALNGDCSILVYTIGEESFIDGDGDGLADAGEFGSDKGEPWLDANENGIKDATEFYADFNTNNTYDGPNADPAFNGVLCNETADPLNPTRFSSPAGICSSQNMMYVWANTTMIWPTRLVGTVIPDHIDLHTCSVPQGETITVLDLNDNTMATGTTIKIDTSEGLKIWDEDSITFTVPGTPQTTFGISLGGSDTCVTGTETLKLAITTPDDVTQHSGITVNVVPLTMGAVSFAADPLSAYRETTVSVGLYNNTILYTNPVSVNFSSICTSLGLATLTESVDTAGGSAFATYKDEGCGAIDTIFVSVTNGPSTSADLTVNALSMSAISAPAISTFGTTPISVALLDGGNPYLTSTPVVFSSACADQGLATITTEVNTVAGVATTSYTDNGCQVSDYITASVPSLNNGPSQEATLTITPLTFSAMTFGSTPLAAYGNTTVKVTVLAGGVPDTRSFAVNFTSACATNDQATITPSAFTQGGTATAYYTDKGCGSDDYITATIVNGPTTATTLTVNTLSIGTITGVIVPLPAYTSRTLSVDVLDGGVTTSLPFTVEFGSSCASSGRATINKTVNTVGGTATTTYTDNGCGVADTITATITNGPATPIANGPSTFTTLAVNALTMDAIVFGSDPLDAYGQTTVEVNIKDGGILTSTPFSVNFASNCGGQDKASITGSVTSNAGVATATYTDNGCGGNDVITVTIPDLENTPSRIGFFTVNPLTMSAITFGGNPIPAYGTTTVEVEIHNGDVVTGPLTPLPFTVNFSSTCAADNLATITSAVNTSGGIAIATYQDNGCQGDDWITVKIDSLANSPISQASLTVTPLTFDPVTFGSNPIPAFGNTTISTTLRQGVNPYPLPTTLKFESICVTKGLASITPPETNTSGGTATVTYQDAGCNGDDLITVTTPDLNNGPKTSATLQVVPVTMSAMTFGDDPLLPYATTTASVTVLDNLLNPYLTPMSVSFDSTCVGNGLATITASVNTMNGIATATYTDNGCGSDDTITATITDGPTSIGSLVVTPLTMEPVIPGVATLSANESASLSVTLKAGLANYLTPTTVAFTSICVQDGKATITPAETNTISGVATATYIDQGCTGDDLITATLPDIVGGPSSTGIITVSPLTMTDPMTFGIDPVSAYGTTTATVQVKSGGALITTPIVVNFSSLCATDNKATISASVITNGGIATATYTDKGCDGNDEITASITDGPSISGTLQVDSPTAGSLQYISATPTTIALKGAGGVTTSLVKFKVLDSLMNPLADQLVSFELTTTIGGLYLTGNVLGIATGTTNIDGEVDVIVNSGTIGTPVRVTAWTAGPVADIYSQSEQLWVSTGLPDQDSFSLSASTWYPPKFWEIDDQTITLTIIASDHFNNPVSDGTTISFTTECGQIGSSCQTTGGLCTVQYKSAGTRPADGNCGILAYAIGEESFIDSDGDGLADLGEFTNLGEPWLDEDDSGDYTFGEFFADFDTDFIYDTAADDPLFNGILCNEDAATGGTSTAGSCSTRNTTYVYRNPVVYWATELVGTFTVSPAPFELTDCITVDDWTLLIEDNNGGPMASGTTFTLADGASGLVEIVGIRTFTTTDAETEAAGNKTQFDFQTIGAATCAAASPTADSIEVTVTPPSGTAQTHVFNVAIP